VKKRLEVLAPAGSMEHIKAAVAAGADAIYFGASAFNARRLAKNIDDSEIKKAVDYCHKRGVCVHGTLNILINDRELEDAIKTAKLFYEAGADALIVQDIGLASVLSEIMPQMPLHASTQLAAHNLEGVLFLEKMGFKRVVLARELSIKEIEYICKNSNVETEVFVHGALYYCVSGQCYFSSVIGQRSGNRGLCAQPCRLPYTISGKSGFPLSLKDLCAGDKLKQLFEAGVDRIKSEGRMKSVNYVYSATKAYSDTVKSYTFTHKQRKELADTFSRSGFTTAYLENNISKDMFGIREESDKDITKAQAAYKFVQKKEIENPIENRYSPIFEYNPIEISNAYFEKKPKIICKFKKLNQIPDGFSSFFWLDISQFDDNIKYENFGLYLPPFIADSNIDKLKETLIKAYKKGVKKLLVGNIGLIELGKAMGFEIHGDFELNVFNSTSALFYSKYLKSITLSPELLTAQIRDIRKCTRMGIIGYGRLPLITSRACLFKAHTVCGKCKTPIILKDRKNEKFPVYSDFGCINRIYNSKPLYVGDLSEIKAMGVNFIRLDFIDENKKQVKKIIDAFKTHKKADFEYTRGLYKRKVL